MTWIVAAAAVAALSFAAPEIARAGEGVDHFGLRARLVPVGDPPFEPEAEGKVELKTKVKGERSWSRFTAKVELPLASDSLLLPGVCEVEGVEVELVITREEVEIARCTLVPAEIELLEEEIEFKADLRERNGVLETKAGSCDTPGIPELMEGDVATASLIDGGETLLVAGEFRLKD
jgi:hypothetical protein